MMIAAVVGVGRVLQIRAQVAHGLGPLAQLRARQAQAAVAGGVLRVQAHHLLVRGDRAGGVALEEALVALAIGVARARHLVRIVGGGGGGAALGAALARATVRRCPPPCFDDADAWRAACFETAFDFASACAWCRDGAARGASASTGGGAASGSGARAFADFSALSIFSATFAALGTGGAGAAAGGSAIGGTTIEGSRAGAAGAATTRGAAGGAGPEPSGRGFTTDAVVPVERFDPPSSRNAPALITRTTSAAAAARPIPRMGRR